MGLACLPALAASVPSTRFPRSPGSPGSPEPPKHTLPVPPGMGLVEDGNAALGTKAGARGLSTTAGAIVAAAAAAVPTAATGDMLSGSLGLCASPSRWAVGPSRARWPRTARSCAARSSFRTREAGRLGRREMWSQPSPRTKTTLQFGGGGRAGVTGGTIGSEEEARGNSPLPPRQRRAMRRGAAGLELLR